MMQAQWTDGNAPRRLSDDPLRIERFTTRRITSELLPLGR